MHACRFSQIQSQAYTDFGNDTFTGLINLQSLFGVPMHVLTGLTGSGF